MYIYIFFFYVSNEYKKRKKKKEEEEKVRKQFWRFIEFQFRLISAIWTRELPRLPLCK